MSLIQRPGSKSSGGSGSLLGGVSFFGESLGLSFMVNSPLIVGITATQRLYTI